MKRLYNNIPLASVLFFVPGYIQITVYDLKLADIKWNKKDATPVNTWDGMGKDSYKMPFRFQYAKVQHIEVPAENRMVFYICTQDEEY